MDALLLIGRILFVPVLISAGLTFHFKQYRMAKGFTQSKGVPAAGVAVIVGGVMLVLGGLSILLGVWADLGALILVAFLVPTALLMHNFWTVEDPQARVMEQTQFTKDIGLAGAALVFFAIVASGGDFGPSITDPLLSL